MSIKQTTIRPLCVGLSLLAVGSVQAQTTVPSLEDLVGARAAGGERALQQRGYNWIRTEKSSGSSYTYWQESENGQCVEVQTTDGRYASIVYASAADCRKEKAIDEGGTSGEPTTTTQNVRFDAGSSGAELSGTLTPGSSARYVLGAKEGQSLYVRVAAQGPEISFQIFNPDGSFLLDQISSAKEYRGQLLQSGDHIVEVINRTQGDASYSVIFGID